MTTRNSALRDKVVVITGASSGLGREAAVEFARRGCSLVLAARRGHALEETAQMCQAAGARVRSVVTDVTSERQVKMLVDSALEEFGRIDVWVNNAAVTLFGLLEDAPFEEHRRVIETNLFGAIYGARAVVPIFRRQGHGILINVGSILGKVGQPFTPSYVISKFGLRGLSDVLSAELADYPDIHVCSLYPYAFNTQHFESGANYVGRQARVMPPAQSPEQVARALVSLAARPRRERHVPRVAVLGLALRYLLPRTTGRLLLNSLRRWHFDENVEPATQGNLYAPPKERPEVHGTRPPQIRAPAFAVWVARELGRIEAQAARRRLRRPRARPRAAREVAQRMLAE